MSSSPIFPKVADFPALMRFFFEGEDMLPREHRKFQAYHGWMTQSICAALDYDKLVKLPDDAKNAIVVALNENNGQTFLSLLYKALDISQDVKGKEKVEEELSTRDDEYQQPDDSLSLIGEDEPEGSLGASGTTRDKLSALIGAIPGINIDYRSICNIIINAVPDHITVTQLENSLRVLASELSGLKASTMGRKTVDLSGHSYKTLHNSLVTRQELKKLPVSTAVVPEFLTRLSVERKEIRAPDNKGRIQEFRIAGNVIRILDGKLYEPDEKAVEANDEGFASITDQSRKVKYELKRDSKDEIRAINIFSQEQNLTIENEKVVHYEFPASHKFLEPPFPRQILTPQAEKTYEEIKSKLEKSLPAIELSKGKQDRVTLYNEVINGLRGKLPDGLATKFLSELDKGWMRREASRLKDMLGAKVGEGQRSGITWNDPITHFQTVYKSVLGADTKSYTTPSVLVDELKKLRNKTMRLNKINTFAIPAETCTMPTKEREQGGRYHVNQKILGPLQWMYSSMVGKTFNSEEHTFDEFVKESKAQFSDTLLHYVGAGELNHMGSLLTQLFPYVSASDVSGQGAMINGLPVYQSDFFQLNLIAAPRADQTLHSMQFKRHICFSDIMTTSKCQGQNFAGKDQFMDGVITQVCALRDIDGKPFQAAVIKTMLGGPGGQNLDYSLINNELEPYMHAFKHYASLEVLGGGELHNRELFIVLTHPRDKPLTDAQVRDNEHVKGKMKKLREYMEAKYGVMIAAGRFKNYCLNTGYEPCKIRTVIHERMRGGTLPDWYFLFKLPRCSPIFTGGYDVRCLDGDLAANVGIMKISRPRVEVVLADRGQPRPPSRKGAKKPPEPASE